MAVSISEICNNALRPLKANPIMTLTDNSEEARLCNQLWPAVRDSVLALHPWNAAMTQAQLVASSTAPTYKWDYAYPLPADCLRLIEVMGSDETAIGKWERQGNEIKCNEASPIFISYVRREEDPTKYDPLLSDVLSAALMARLAFPLTASKAAQEAAYTLYINLLRDARGVDARQGANDDVVATSWTIAKLGGGRVR